MRHEGNPKMKKIIRRIFLAIFAVIFLAVAAVAAYLFMPERDSDTVARPTVTDKDGNSYLVTNGDNGETYAAVTDADGNIWAAQIDSDGKPGVTVSSLNDVFDINEIPGNYNGPVIDDVITSNAYTGQVNAVSTTAPTTTVPTTAAPTTTAPSQIATTAPEPGRTFLIHKYQLIFASNNYLIEFTTNDETLGDTPILSAAKNGNILVETSIEGMKCKLLYLAQKDTTYLLLDGFKKYCKVPESFFGDNLNMSELGMGKKFVADISDDEIEVSTVEINGRVLTCESYTTQSGTQMKYYFDSDTLVRLDSISPEGKLASTYITRITSEVPDETFDIPSDYGYLNLSWLDFLGGEKN